MFGLGFTKLAVLIAIVAAVWYGFKYVGQLDQARKKAAKGGRTPGKARSAEPEDTVECPVCGAYVVAKSASPCERPDCPY